MEDEELSEEELIAALRQCSWSWLAGIRRPPDPEPEEPPPEIAAPPAEAPSKRRRTKREALPEAVIALRRAAWSWLKPPASEAKPRKPRVKREALPEGVSAFRRAAWSWLKPAASEAKARKPRVKREALPAGVTALRRAAWSWLKPAASEAKPRKPRAKREALPEALIALRRAAWSWLRPPPSKPSVEPPAKRRRGKREPLPEAVIALRRAAWSWLARRPAPSKVALPAVAAPPTAPDNDAPVKRRRVKREVVPEGVLDLRRRAWAWFAPKATGEAAAGMHVPLRVPREAEAGHGGDVVRSHLKGVLEALIFASESPLPARELARLAKADLKVVKSLLGELVEEYHGRGFRLDEIAGGFVFRTSPLFAPFVREQVAKKPVRMSRAQIETLAIVAYRQPITRPEVDEVRGVDSGAVLKSLLERDLVRILGKKDEPGRPMLYGTTGSFLEFFGLRALGDLPTLREFTELTDESKRAYERELGEEPPDPGAPPPPAEGLMGGEGDFRRAAAPDPGAPASDDGASASADAGDGPSEPRVSEAEDEVSGSIAVDASENTDADGDIERDRGIDGESDMDSGNDIEPENVVEGEGENAHAHEEAHEDAENDGDEDDEEDDEDEDDEEDDEDEDDEDEDDEEDDEDEDEDDEDDEEDEDDDEDDE